MKTAFEGFLEKPFDHLSGGKSLAVIGSGFGTVLMGSWVFDVCVIWPILTILVLVGTGVLSKSQNFRGFMIKNFNLPEKSSEKQPGSPGAEKTEQKNMDTENFPNNTKNSFLKNCQMVGRRVNYKISSTTNFGKEQTEVSRSQILEHSELNLTKKKIESHLHQTNNSNIRRNVIEIPDFSSDNSEDE